MLTAFTTRRDVDRVHDKKIIFTAQSVKVAIVHRPTAIIWNDRILCLPRPQGRGVVGQAILEERECGSTAYYEPAHVGDVE
jgi:hypothetical protein